MKTEEIKSNADLLNYIEGCVNDFEMGVSDKNELMNNILGLCIYTAETGVGKPELDYYEEFVSKSTGLEYLNDELTVKQAAKLIRDFNEHHKS